MEVSLRINEELLEAAKGDIEKCKCVYERATDLAQRIIDEEGLGEYEEKDVLLKCGIYMANDLLITLKRHATMDRYHLSTICHYPYLRHSIFREMVSLIKSKGRKDQEYYHRLKEKIKNFEV